MMLTCMIIRRNSQVSRRANGLRSLAKRTSSVAPLLIMMLIVHYHTFNYQISKRANDLRSLLRCSPPHHDANVALRHAGRDQRLGRILGSEES